MLTDRGARSFPTVLHCRDFERTWNDLLDERTALDDRLSSLESHAASCEGCRAIHARYLTLSHAIREPMATPGRSADFAGRVVAAWEAETSRVSDARPVLLRLAARMAVLTAAAVLVVGMTIAISALRSGTPPADDLLAGGSTRLIAPTTPGAFSEALADATSVTLELARETSAPAARLGRDVLDSAELPSAPPAVALNLPVDMPMPSSETWQRVGNRLNAGVRPLEGSARRAFSFLRIPSNDAKPTPRPARGA